MIDSNQNNTEIPADPQNQVPQTSIKVVAARAKAKAKPQKSEPVETPSIIPMHERKWIDIEPSAPSLTAYEVSRKVISLLRHNQTVQREEDGAIEFFKIKIYLRNHHSQIQNWSDDRWKSCLATGGGSKRRYQCCSDDSGRILYLRALQGHSGNNLIDPRDKNHKDPECFAFSVPRRARYVHSAWKKHQDAVFWVNINLSIREGLTFYQTRSNAILLQGTPPAYYIPKVERLKTGEVLCG